MFIYKDFNSSVNSVEVHNITIHFARGAAMDPSPPMPVQRPTLEACTETWANLGEKAAP